MSMQPSPTLPGTPDAPVLFVSDVHGEYDEFAYILESGCGGAARGTRHVYLLGDIYDRGPAPDRILDMLMERDDVDIVWGNHDIVWMGAALGQAGCIAHVVRNCARYGNLDILEESYGIDLAALYEFAAEAYADDPCDGFALKSNPGFDEETYRLNVQVQKAMAVIQFKVEAALIDEYPIFGLDDRKLLGRIDYESGSIEVDESRYELVSTLLPTVDAADPYTLTGGEVAVVEALVEAFKASARLQKHIAYLLEVGSLYRTEGDLLMFHACVPLKEDGTPLECALFDGTYAGKALFDKVDACIREAFTAEDETARKQGRDLLWYLWLGPASPLFAKSKMATFEIYMIADKAARKEVKNPFYSMLGDVDVVEGLLAEFGVDPRHGCILHGHVPVKVKDGADPIECDGRAVNLDGGMSAAYRKTTGVAGFTLVSDGQELRLGIHRSFEEDALETEWRKVARS